MEPTMKTCGRCKEVKPVEDFYWKNKQKTTRAYCCKSCALLNNKEYYNRNIERTRGPRLRINRRNKRKWSEFVREYKNNKPCVDCGVCYPYYILDFDHVRGTKFTEISKMSKLGYGPKLLEEIEKCDLVCANCHRERTHQKRSGCVV